MTTEWKQTKHENPDFKCIACKSNEIQYRVVEDDEGHEDYHYRCTVCGRQWWFEGADY